MTQALAESGGFLMALSMASTATKAASNLSFSSGLHIRFSNPQFRRPNLLPLKCEVKESQAETDTPKTTRKLEIGSPIIVTEAPPVIKTAASITCLIANTGLVKAGDVGRIMSRKPKDVWAVRLAAGTYLIDGKYFKPLEVDNE